MLKRGIVMAGLVVALSTQALASEDEALVSFKVMTLETAQTLAQATLDDCRKRGYQVAVSVVDRSGVLQVTLRDRFAGAHTPETARRKAWTSVSFRTDTLPMVEETQSGRLQAGARHVSDALMVGGGVLVISQFTLHAKEDVQVYAVPSASSMDIPVVRWKLFESWNKRLQERVGNA